MKVVDSGQLIVDRKVVELARVLEAAYDPDVKTDWDTLLPSFKRARLAQARATFKYLAAPLLYVVDGEKVDLAAMDDVLQASRLVKGEAAFGEDLLAAYGALKDVVRSQGELIKEWQGTAESYQRTLQETTATMNRYYGDWQAAVGQVQQLQGDLSAAKVQAGRPLPEASPLAQIFWRGYSNFNFHKLSTKTQSDIEQGINRVLGALGPHLGQVPAGLTKVMESLDGEKRGRLAAELRIDELTAELAKVRAASAASLRRAEETSELRAMDLRGNHANEIASLQAMLGDKEREARHGTLMVEALSFGMDEGEYDRVHRECWKLMKQGEMVSIDNGQLTIDNGEEMEGGAA